MKNNSITLEEQLEKIEKYILKYPRSNIKTIAQGTGINRQILYTRILLLKERGKVMEHEIGRSKVFEPIKGVKR